MKHNPLSDVVDFLQQPGWTTIVFWVLLLASIVIAIYAFAAIRDQRRPIHIWNWGFRLLIGCMWW